MIAWVQDIDVSVLHFVNYTLRNSVFDFICPVLRNKLTWIPLYVILGILLIKRDRRTALIWIIIVVIAAVSADQLSMVFKNYFARLRPCHEEELLQWLAVSVRCGTSFAFVSAHACSHFAQAFLYHHIFNNRTASVLFFVWAGVISFAQMYVGVHYPSDILAGALLGLTIGYGLAKAGNRFIGK